VLAVKKMIEEMPVLKQQIESFKQEKTASLYNHFKSRIRIEKDINIVEISENALPADIVKDLAFRFRNEYKTSLCFIAATTDNGKPLLTLMLSNDLISAGKDASAIVRSASKHIQGGGGGQKHFATAGGKAVSGLQNAVFEIRQAVLTN
jgi:alanyl-tRNA synthetase